MQAVLEQLPAIIQAAARSSLGIIALMVIVVAGLAHAFFRRSSEPWRFSALGLLFAGCIAFGYSVFKSAPADLADQVSGRATVQLAQSLDTWLAEAEKAREAGTLSGAGPLPSALVDARNQFESRWRQSSLRQRQALPPERVASGLSLLNRLYREVESDSSVQPTASFWADEAIRYFDERQDARRLTEALLDKAAIYLDIAQLGNNDKQQFDAMARSGDALMTRAARIAADDQRPTVLRIASRFYYNLARPRSFRLSDAWDNNYLLLAYEKAREAHGLQPGELKSASQLARTVIKVAKNPPQDADPQWAGRLREAQEGMLAAWDASRTLLTGAQQRLSPLDVLGVTTLEAIAREWSAAGTNERRTLAGRYLIELERDGLSPLREAAALLQNSALRKSYGFDIRYDLARAHAEFKEVKANLVAAREEAKTAQLEAALRDLGHEISFSLLTAGERRALAQLLNPG